MATCGATDPVIDQAENLAVVGLVVYIVPDPGEALSAPSFTLVPPISQLTVVPSMDGAGNARFDLSAPNLYGMIPEGTISYVVGTASNTVTAFESLPAVPPVDIFDYQPSGTQLASAVLTVTAVSSLSGPVSFPLGIVVQGSYDTGKDRLTAAVAALGTA